MKYLNPYRLAILTKNSMYEKSWLKPKKFNIPVISVGNLTTGGTGKTPVVLELISLLKGQSILVVSKSYKANLLEPAEVTLENLVQTKIYGDEPCLIKKMAPEVIVFSGPHKTETVDKALIQLSYEQRKVDVVIVDDAFSHRTLYRDLDLVLIDVSQKMSHYKLIPFGHLREDVDQIFRADLVILTKVNNANPQTLKHFRDFLAAQNIHFIESNAKSVVANTIKRLFLFSGIGNPAQLKLNLENSGFTVVKHLIYPDHHAYSAADQNHILHEWRTNFSDSALCATEKDLVKLTNDELKNNTHTISLQLEFSEKDKDMLNAKLSQICQ